MPAAVPPSFAIECACGTWSRGDRQAKSQILTCPGCGKPVFVFPAAASMFGPAVPTGPANWSKRLGYWLPPAAAAVLALVVVGVVIAAIVRGRRPAADSPSIPQVSASRAAIILNEKWSAARTALEEGSYHTARTELNTALGLAGRHPGLLDVDRTAQLTRWQRQADLLADLLGESIGDVVRLSIARADREWDAIFRERYFGKSVILDTHVVRETGGHVRVDYHLEAAGAVGEWDLDKLRLLEQLPLEQPQRMLFGFRLRSVRRLARDRWAVVPEPASGVLLTDPEVLAGISVTSDEELIEVLRRQLRWDSGG
jgi:hypothetical protein